jgi:O-antigen/teichoic acid export membrane protein
MLVLRTPEIFDSQSRSVRIGTRAARGGTITLVAQVMMFATQVVGTMVLARLLTPADYGLIGMVAVILALGVVLQEAGLSTATIQQPHITQEQVSALFWANTLISVVLSVIVAAAAPLIAAFYHQPSLVAVTMVLAVSFGVNGLNNEHLALLNRAMYFKSLAVIQFVPQLAYFGVAIGLGIAGARYWALVAGSMAQAVLSLVLALALCRWLPGRLVRHSGVGAMLRFGGNVLGFNILDFFSQNLDNILIGRYLGPTQLGLYSKAYGLFSLPVAQFRTPVQRVALPVLSTLRDDPVRYRRYYRHAVNLLAFLTVPFTLVCFWEAPFLIGLLLGPQWLGAVPVFRILAVPGLIQAVISTRGLVLLSQGRADRFFRWGVVNAVVTSAAFFAGLPYGIAGVAVAYGAAKYVLLIPSLFYSFHGTPVRVADVVRALLAPLAIGALASLVFLAPVLGLGASTVVNIALCIAFMAVYCGVSWSLPSFRETAGAFWHALRGTGAADA